jgi:hypothetical protein
MFYLLCHFSESGATIFLVTCLCNPPDCLSTHCRVSAQQSSADGDVVTLITIAQQAMEVLRTADIDQWFAPVMKAVYGLVKRKQKLACAVHFVPIYNLGLSSRHRGGTKCPCTSQPGLGSRQSRDAKDITDRTMSRPQNILTMLIHATPLQMDAACSSEAL